MFKLITPKNASKTCHFYLKMDHHMAPWHTPLRSFGIPITMEQQRPSLETPT